MKQFKQTLCLLLTAVLLCALALTAAPAYAAEYQDGDYTVAFSMEGLGRHNVAWDTATVHVKDGKLYVDFTLERVDPRNHAPQYDWLKTERGKFIPSINDEKFTCTFSWVEVSHLGRVDVVAYSAPMATEMDYTMIIDDSKIPTAAAPAPDPTPDPEPTPTPDPAPAPEPAPAPDPTPEPSPTPDPDPVDPVEPTDPIAPADSDEPVSSEDPVEPTTPDDTATIGEDTPKSEIDPEPNSVPVSPGTLEYDDNHLPLSGGAIAAIAAGAVIVLGVIVWLIVRNKRK